MHHDQLKVISISILLNFHFISLWLEQSKYSLPAILKLKYSTVSYIHLTCSGTPKLTQPIINVTLYLVTNLFISSSSCHPQSPVNTILLSTFIYPLFFTSNMIEIMGSVPFCACLISFNAF